MIVRVAGRALALPVAHVIETMRPLPVARAGPVVVGPATISHPALLGVAQIRGAPCPVVDLAKLLELPPATAATADAAAARYVVVRAGGAAIALVVDAVLGVRAIDRGEPVSKSALWPTHPREMTDSPCELLPARPLADDVPDALADALPDALPDALADALAGALWLSPADAARAAEAG